MDTDIVNIILKHKPYRERAGGVSPCLNTVKKVSQNRFSSLNNGHTFKYH